MRHLAYWREREQKLFEYEKELYAVFSPRELWFYELAVYTKDRVRTAVRPLVSWWYGKTADRASELYAREKTSDHLRLWYLAEVRATRARGVQDWYVSYVDEAPQADQRLATEAWLLRKARTDWSKLKPTETLR